MDIQKVTKELKDLYPNRNIIINDPDNPTEVVCEVEPASWNPDKSIAIAVIDSTVSHLHRQSRETYEVIKGVLEMDRGGNKYILTQGQSLTIEPTERHTAKGKETWVKVTSVPGWKPEDH